MKTVRPSAIFALADGDVRLSMPQAGDGMTILETCLLIAAMRYVMAESVFEFGTFRGRTTLNLAKNIKASLRMVYTLDLEGPIVPPHAADAHDMMEHFSAERMAFQGLRFAQRIRRLTCANSRIWVPPEDLPNMEFILIDGGHDYDTVNADTKNAFNMLAPGGVIAWHDYGSPTYPDLTRYLDGLALPLVHPAETILAFYGLPL